MEYRKEIDGLRALAVVPVIFFHAGISWFSGGFVGVDIFFVISGYLITTILLAEHEAGSFSLLKFYERRARRILPALFCVMLVSLPFAWFWMLPDQLKEFSQSELAVSAFASNILFWKQSGYFDASAELKPLLHTWSLAVEEQYYVLFPLLLAFFWRFGKGWFGLRSLFLLIAVASLLLSQSMVNTDSAFAFYLLPTRAWELLVGAMIPLLWTVQQRADTSLMARQLLSALGLMLIVYAIFCYDRHTPFPSFYALVPTIGAALVITFADAPTIVAKILSLRWVAGVGLVSYSTYLWHQPVLAFFRIKTTHTELPTYLLLPYLMLVFVLAYLSYKFVEQPFRSKARVSRNKIFFLALLGTVFFAGIGFFGHSSNGFYAWKIAGIASEKKALLIQVEKEKNARLEAFATYQNALMQADFSPLTTGRRVVVLGDSMGADLSLTLAENHALFGNDEFRYLSVTNECLDALYSALNSSCASNLKAVMASKLLASSDLIVVTFLWKEEANFAAIEKLLADLKAINNHVLILGSAGFLDMASVAYKIAADNAVYTQADIDTLVAKSRRNKFDAGNAHIKTLASKLNVPYFDRHALYCDAAQDQCRILNLEGGSVLWDNAHLTQQGRKITAEKLLAIGWLNQPAYRVN